MIITNPLYTQDPTGQWWQVGVNTGGLLTTTPVSFGTVGAPAPGSTSTIQLNRTVGLAQKFIRNAPLVLDTTSNDPAFSIGDWVRGFILGPPFAWRWNRVELPPIACVVGTQDYTVSIGNFGWLECATITMAGAVPPTMGLEVSLSLDEETVTNVPARISAHLDDGRSNITFRLFPPPDQAYTLQIHYQKSAPLFANLTDSWNPIPDYLSYLYNQGFLAKTYEYMGDERFTISLQLFLKQLLGACQGLKESQVNIFLPERVDGRAPSAVFGATGPAGGER